MGSIPLPWVSVTILLQFHNMLGPFLCWIELVLVWTIEKQVNINSQSTCNTSCVWPVRHQSSQWSQFHVTAVGLETVTSAAGWSWCLKLVTQIHAERLFLIKHANKFKLRKACVEDDRKWWENYLHHTASEQKRALWVAAFSFLRLCFRPSSPHSLTCFVSLVHKTCTPKFVW